MKNNSCYVAFLRGINVGGQALIKMIDLKKAFEKMGFEQVRTLLASGNVVFECEQTEIKTLSQDIASVLKKEFGSNINVVIRNMDDLKKLQSSEPFKGIKVTQSIRLYVTFLSEKTKPRTIKIPYTSPRNEFQILRATPMEVFSVLDLSKGKGTTEVVNMLEKEFGANLTTRIWNTILKVINRD